jgi:hypothetical protein
MGFTIFSHINWLAVLVGAAAYFLLGAIWYSFLFRDAWIKASGVKMDDPNAKTGVGAVMTFSFILILLTTLGLAIFITLMGAVVWMAGAKIGLVVGVCFCATAICNSYLYEKRPLAIHLINSGYNIVGCVIAGIILAVWH